MPRIGLEPTRLSTLAPETSASTISPSGLWRCKGSKNLEYPSILQFIFWRPPFSNILRRPEEAVTEISVAVFLFFKNNMLNLHCFALGAGFTYRKCFRCPTRKCGSFQERRMNEWHSLLVCIWQGTYWFFNVFYPHIIRVWGLASFIFVRVFPQPSCW